MEQADIDKTILFSTTPHPERADTLESFEIEMSILNDVLSGKCTPEERVRSIESTTFEICERIKKYPDKFLGFGAIPLSLSYKEICHWVDINIISNGLLGIGELAFSTGRADLLENIFKASMEFNGLPLWIHTFHPLNLTDIKSIAGLARKYINIPVIFGHMGGLNWLDAIKIAKEQSNIYLDLSATYTVLAPKLAVNELPLRVLFSSDAPYGNPLLLRKMVEMISTDENVTKRVLGGNIAELLDI
jgi:predicted TIM-barrel fold metal-dependent hydrolase